MGTTTDWDNHRPTIERLYRQYDLNKVMKEMESTHGFKKSERTYRRRIHQWGLRKNFPQAVWEQVISKTGARERGLAEGSGIQVNGQEQSYQKLKRKLREVSGPTLAEKFSFPSQSQEEVPDTLPAPLMTFSSPPLGPFTSTDAPWINFTALWEDSISKGLVPSRSPLHFLECWRRRPPYHHWCDINARAGVWKLFPLRIRGRIMLEDVPLNRITAALCMGMPSRSLQHCEKLAEDLYGFDSFGSASASSYAYPFFLSNNHFDMPAYFSKSASEMDYHKHNTGILQAKPFSDIESLRGLLSTSNASFRVVLETCCNSVLRTFEPRVFRVCLEAGLWPEGIYRSGGNMLCLLDLAACYADPDDTPEITHLILARRKDSVPTSRDLANALSFENVAMATELVQLGAKVEVTHLESSILWRRTASTQFCLGQRVNSDIRLTLRQCIPNHVPKFLKYFTELILRRMDRNARRMLMKFLDADPRHAQKGEDSSGTDSVLTESVSLTALGFSIATHHYGVQPALIAQCQNTDAEQRLHFAAVLPGCLRTSTIGLAVLLRNNTAVAKLTRANADPNPVDGLVPPLILACIIDNAVAIDLLLRAGANVGKAENHHVMVENRLSLLDILLKVESYNYKTYARMEDGRPRLSHFI